MRHNKLFCNPEYVFWFKWTVSASQGRCYNGVSLFEYLVIK